jgi:hypothetical protein
MFVHIEFNIEGGYQILELVTSSNSAWRCGFSYPDIDLNAWYGELTSSILNNYQETYHD